MIDIYGDPEVREREEREERERQRRIAERRADIDDLPFFSDDWLALYARECSDWHHTRRRLHYAAQVIVRIFSISYEQYTSYNSYFIVVK